jgi:5-methylcytosine-specific restriction endonuclease McrA
MAIDYTEFLFGKGQPRAAAKLEKDRKRESDEDRARKALKIRDKGRCFFPGCKRPATEVHHILPRSVRGKTVWQTDDLLSACSIHHKWFKAQLITVDGNPDKGPVRVTLTTLGKEAKIQILKNK